MLLGFLPIIQEVTSTPFLCLQQILHTELTEGTQELCSCVIQTHIKVFIFRATWLVLESPRKQRERFCRFSTLDVEVPCTGTKLEEEGRREKTAQASASISLHPDCGCTVTSCLLLLTYCDQLPLLWTYCDQLAASGCGPTMTSCLWLLPP